MTCVAVLALALLVGVHSPGRDPGADPGGLEWPVAPKRLVAAMFSDPGRACSGSSPIPGPGTSGAAPGCSRSRT